MFAEVGNSDMKTGFPSASAVLVSGCWVWWVACCCFLCRRMNRKRKSRPMTARTAATAIPALAPGERSVEPVGLELPNEVPVGPGTLDVVELLENVCN